MWSTNWNVIGAIVRTAGGAVALVGIPLAYVTYRRSVRTRRAEWLGSLHEKFFETDRYSTVRRVLDYREEPVYSELGAAVASALYHPLVDELWRYLNFFELLAGLRQLRQISDEEILRLLDYDLRLIKSREFIQRALEPEGFDGLAQLLTSLPLATTTP